MVSSYEIFHFNRMDEQSIVGYERETQQAI
jgi:hypothetical protein